MAPKRKQKQKPEPKHGVLKPNQRFVIQKTGKLARTNLIALFNDPELWDALTATQQRDILISIGVQEIFGENHPLKLDSGKFINYFIVEDPLARSGLPDRQTAAPGDIKSYIPMEKHLEAFRERLLDGNFDPKWMARSEEISQMRARGDYDDLWEYDEEAKLSAESKAKVAAVKAKREERRKQGLE